MGDTACGSSEGAESLRRIEKHRASRGEPGAPATIRGGGDVAELVDASDLKSADIIVVRVQVSLWVLTIFLQLMTEQAPEFPFDDIEKLELEEDELPIIPAWPSIFELSTTNN